MPPFCPIHDFRNRWDIPKMRPSSAEPPDAIHRVDIDSFLREPNKVRRDPREQATIRIATYVSQGGASYKRIRLMHIQMPHLQHSHPGPIQARGQPIQEARRTAQFVLSKLRSRIPPENTLTLETRRLGPLWKTNVPRS